MRNRLTDGIPAPYTNWQLAALVTLRFLIGWHVLYEGLSKIWNPWWTAAGYLASAQGPFDGIFVWMAADPGRLAIVDFLNEWGLILVGLALMLGILTRTATVLALVMILLYYLATPPWPGLEYALPLEGSYLIVNRNLVEVAALWVTLVLPTGRQFGLDRLIFKARSAGAPAHAA
jgi:thiosulfate dehydrogenase [quinone] large subunit